jgi:VCBS repeat-containing protein
LAEHLTTSFSRIVISTRQGANNTYTYTDKTISFGPNGTIADQYKTTDNYKDATGEISGGTYNGGSFTSMGFTEFYNADGVVTNTNYAPTSEINNIAPSSTPSSGILPPEDELTTETYAGNVTESNSAATSTVTGTITTSDADGDTLSLKLMGGTTSGTEQTLDGQFGKLTLNSNGTYEYELDNAKSELDGLNDGDIETESFVVEVKDNYHTTYQMLDFEILGKNDVVANQPGVGYDIEVDGGGPVQVGSKLIAVTSSLQDPDGLPDGGLDIYWYAENQSGSDEILFNGPEYTVKSSDAGKTIYGKVDYIDDAGNNESVASGAKLSVAGSYDNVAPVVTAFTASIGDGTYGAGTNILIKATLSEPVLQDNTIIVTLNNGGQVELKALTAGTVLEGTYTVSQTDTNTNDLTVSSYTIVNVVDVVGNSMSSNALPAVGSNLGDTSEIKIDTSGGSGSETPFSIDIASTNDISFSAKNFSAQSEMTVQGDATNGYFLEAAKLNANTSVVRDNVNNMSTANPFSISVNIDGIANFTTPKTESITVLVRDDNSGGNADTKEAGEREVSTTFMVRAEGNGSAASVTALTGSTETKLTKSNGDVVLLTLNNVEEDVINIGSGSLNSPNSLNLKVESLLDSIDQYVDVNMLSQVGNYYYEITGLNNLLNEVSNSSSVPINKIVGTISVESDLETPFSISLAGTNDISFNAMNWTAQADMTLGGSVSNGFHLNASELTVDSTIVRENVNGMSSANPFGISVNLDNVAKFTSPKNEEIKIIVRDLSDGGSDGVRDAGEREVSTTFQVRAEGDGTDASVVALPGNTTTLFTKSNGDTISVNLNNVGEDVINLSSGINNSPASLNFKIAELLEDIGGYVDVNMLSGVGKYEYEISGLENILNEPDGNGDLRAIDKIIGKINVVNDEAVSPNITGINLSFDEDGAAGGSSASYDLDLSTKTYSSDDYISVSLKSGDTISAQKVNDLDNPGVNFVPNITIDLDSAIDTGSSSINQDVRIEIVEIDAIGSPASYLNTHQNGNRKVQLDFDLNRKGDGSEEVWSSISGDQMSVKVWNTDNSSSPKVTSNITNQDIDTFIAPVSSNGQTGNSLDIKLQSLLDKVNDITSTPTAQAGDMYALTVSFIDDSNQSDIILSGEFTLT